MRSQGLYFLCVIATGLLLPCTGFGFGGKAHEALSLRAVNPNVTNASQLDSYLKTVLGFEFPQGIGQEVSGGETVEKLIADGSIDEDKPLTRVLHHFHDPTRTWNQAGLWIYGIPSGNSSVVWSQMSPQGACCGNYAWKDARDAYFNALTSTTDSQRKSWYAKTFRTLGHLIHHVQDAAAPSHTRNDSHLQFFESSMFPDGDPFHQWADGPGLSKINQSASVRFDPSILNQASANPLAPVPVARIIDKTDGDIGILSPNVNIGLAEYSNANFISKDTAFSTSYQYPRLSQMQFGAVETMPNGKQRRYARFLPGFGEQDYRVGVVSRTILFANNMVPVDIFGLGLDDNIHEDYGRKLFPRAIGYSAGLLDYFFRGEITTIDGLPQPASCDPAPIICVNLSNTTVDEETEGAGEVTAVVRCCVPTFDAIYVSAPVPITLTREPQYVAFTLNDVPSPGAGADVKYGELRVVYKGHLGKEEGAIISGVACFGSDGAINFETQFNFSMVNCGN
jgi:hypothetical protein